MTRTELAAFFGVAKGTITRWEKDGMPPGKKAGRGKETLFNADECKRWKDEQDAEGADSFLSLEAARTRLAIAQAEKVERENRVSAGELVEVRDMIGLGQVFIKALTSKVRAIPRRLVQIEALARDKEAAAAELVREVLNEIAGWRGISDLERAGKGLPPKPVKGKAKKATE